ncbi:MAG: peptidase [Saprospiraceae bacterium]|nr:peptidase [Saprospiraceae bacterium]
MASMLPMFPLQLVVFPGERLNLHIFEPRYKQLINDCRTSGSTFGLPAFIDDQVMPVATEMIVHHVHKVYPDGKMDIRTLGKRIVQISNFQRVVDGKLYGGASADPIEITLEGVLTRNIELLKLVHTLHKLMDIRKTLPEKTDHGITYQLAHHVGLNIQQEYALLELPDEADRQDYLIDHLTRLIPIVREMNALREKVQMNGHFRNILPPET